MACFIVPLTVGIVLGVLKKAAKTLAERLKLDLLVSMMLGGAAVLSIEHMYHGEVVPWPPFLTAMSNPSEWGAALHEMATAGTAMTLAVTGIWATILALTKFGLKPAIRARPVKQVTGAIS